jgi:hypothetical protein
MPGKLATLTIFGVPEFRYELAQKSRRTWEEAVAACQGATSDKPDFCRWLLVDKLGERPPLSYYWDRNARGWIEPERVPGWGDLLTERAYGQKYGHAFTPPGKPAFTAFAFRHTLHFGTVQVYEPELQSVLDARAAKREANRQARAIAAERSAAPLFFTGSNA